MTFGDLNDRFGWNPVKSRTV